MLDNLPGINDILAQNDVAFAGLFGSYARGDETPGSDIDILVRFSKPKGLFDLVHLKHLLTSRLGREVDLVTEGALSPYIRGDVMRDLTVLYGQR